MSNRKRFLSLLVLSTALIGLAFLTAPFVSSLWPSAKTNPDLKNYFKVSTLHVGNEKEIMLWQKPALIVKSEDEDVVVWNLLPQFSDSTKGCTIRRNDNPHGRYARAAFKEPCRFVAYDAHGNVMEGGHPSALPMQKIEFEVLGDMIVIYRGS